MNWRAPQEEPDAGERTLGAQEPAGADAGEHGPAGTLTASDLPPADGQTYALPGGTFFAVEAGQIKALWIIHSNPAVTLPEADKVRAAIAGCDFVVVSDVTGATDTARLAHVLLPAAAWGEKDGTVTNTERRISRQRGFLTAPGEEMRGERPVVEAAVLAADDGDAHTVGDGLAQRDCVVVGAEMMDPAGVGSRQIQMASRASRWKAIS